jgi:hypothetical protein
MRPVDQALRRAGVASCLGLGLSGLAITTDPRRVSAAVHLAPASERGVAEIRAGLGGTFMALAGWALVRKSADAYAAVGVTWLGAAVVRLAALRVDRPRTDLSYWAYLAAEIGLGLTGIAAAFGTTRARTPTAVPS